MMCQGLITRSVQALENTINIDTTCKGKEISRVAESGSEAQNLIQGSTLRVNLWPQASKNSPKQLRASKKRPQLVLQAQ